MAIVVLSGKAGGFAQDIDTLRPPSRTAAPSRS